MGKAGFTDVEIERLLTGGVVDDAYATLANLLAEVGRLAEYQFEDGYGSQIVASSAALALETRPSPAPTSAAPSARRRRRFTPVLTTTALVMALLVGTSGLAFAANSSAPGDALYGIDRALENIGIADGGVSERLAEAQELVDGGEPVAGLEHAAEAYEDSGDQASASALLATAETLRANPNGSDNAIDVRNGVADMLEWMATTEVTGRDFGQGIAERARQLGQAKDKPNPPGQSEGRQGNEGNGNGNGPPDGVPGGGPN